MPKTDIVVVIKFNIEEPENTLIKTNVKKKAVNEILENWIRSQLGAGKDDSKSVEKDIYEIVIKLDLGGDIFHTSSDTGNKSLTCGLVMDVFTNLKKIPVHSLT